MVMIVAIVSIAVDEVEQSLGLLVSRSLTELKKVPGRSCYDFPSSN